MLLQEEILIDMPEESVQNVFKSKTDY